MPGGCLNKNFITTKGLS